MNEIFLQNGKKIWLSSDSVRSFTIHTNHPDISVVRDSNDNFLEIKFSNLLSFKKGDKIIIKDNEKNNYITFILNDISNISKNSYKGIEQKTNKTCIFILPILEKNYIHFDYNYSLYNCYISETLDYLYLKYKFVDSEDYINLEEKLQEHKDFVEFFDEDENFVVFKFRIDNKYRYDIKNILDGKYSSISEELKIKVLLFHGLKKESNLGYILYKDEKYKKALEDKLKVKIPNTIDLMSKGNKEEEIWNYQSISQQIGTTN